MTCYFPLTAWKSADLDDINSQTGKIKMVFREDQGFPNTKTELPCGQCIGCRLDKSREWAIRCLHEAQLHQENCFITLTYQNTPETLNKRDMQLFLKKLRKRYPEKTIRYYQCGEYGEKFNRPHHHILLFGYRPKDCRYFSRRNDINIYLSKEIAELWPHGFHTVGDVTFESAQYVAKYMMKKINGDKKEEHYNGKHPEYATMSRRPGIGSEWFDRFSEDLYNHDRCVVSHGNIARPPKYYDRMYDIENSKHFAQLKRQRRANALSNPDNCEDRRLAKYTLAKLKERDLAKRSFETHGPPSAPRHSEAEPLGAGRRPGEPPL